MAVPRPADTGSRGGPSSGRRRRASHSLEAVVGEAVALLDESGDSALTFRALAARLGGGVGSIYWYVSNREELLDRASDHVLAGVLRDTERYAGGHDPIEDIRGIAMTLFDAVDNRPWLGAYFMRDTGAQPNALALYERLGQQVLRLGLDPRQSFDATSAVLGYVIGIAADLGRQPPQQVLNGEITREEYTEWFAARWREQDPAEYPFLHHIVDVFATHDDRAQFRAGLDLLLAGIRLEAGD